MIQVTLRAMGNVFELTLHGDDPVRLRAAGDEALGEIDRLEEQLSHFRPTTEIAAVNRFAAGGPVKVGPAVIAFLQRCREVATATGGAFDPTIGPVIRVLRQAQAYGAQLDPRAVEQARAAVGIDAVEIDADASTVRFVHPGVSLDVGSAARGYAIDRAIEILRDHGVTSAMLRSGSSGAHVIGVPPGEAAWRIAWEAPAGSAAKDRELSLVDQAVSFSGRQGRSHQLPAGAEIDIRDPRTGDAVVHTLAAGVIGPSSFYCDMLSTALLVAGASWLDTLAARFPDYTGWVAEPDLAHLA
jgi:thiamine biosynthesis lipoprotein